MDDRGGTMMTCRQWQKSSGCAEKYARSCIVGDADDAVELSDTKSIWISKVFVVSLEDENIFTSSSSIKGLNERQNNLLC